MSQQAVDRIEPRGSEWQNLPWESHAIWPWICWAAAQLADHLGLRADEPVELHTALDLATADGGPMASWPAEILDAGVAGLRLAGWVDAEGQFLFSPPTPPSFSSFSLTLKELKNPEKRGCKGRKTRTPGMRAEIDWRVRQAWQAHIRQRELFLEHHRAEHHAGEHLADAITFLLGEDARYINGHDLVVDGGTVGNLLGRSPGLGSITRS